LINQRIREARRAKGLSQGQLAKGIVSRSYVTALENGRINPTAENLRLLAERLGQPMSYFMPDKLEEAVHKLDALLNQTKAHLALREHRSALDVFQMCTALFSSALPSATLALYYEVQAEVEGKNGALLKAVMAYMLSAREYAALDKRIKAWECKYTAAHSLYTAGHMDHAIYIAIDAAKSLTPCDGDAEFLALTHYFIGCAYSAKGDVTSAQSYFRQAEMEAPRDADTVLRSLIAQSSCAFRQGDLAKALQMSQQAAELAAKSKRDHLKTEALIAVAVCLVKMGDTDKASGALSLALSGPSVPTQTKCKAYREIIFALIDSQLTHLSAPYEDGLRLALADDNGTDNWERVKSLWALEKCRLHRDPKNVREEITRFANAFRDLMRYRDAADVLLFGADIMKGQGHLAEAVALMESAVAHLRGQA